MFSCPPLKNTYMVLMVSLSAWGLKETADLVVSYIQLYPLSTAYSRSLDTGVLPDGWKKGHVTPVYKKDGHSQA